MNKNKIITLAVASALLALTACTNETGIGTDVDAGSITIQATIGQMTKVENKGNATNFTDGDKILLYGWTGSDKEIPATRVVDSVVNSFDGTAWTPAKQMNWKNATDAHYFLGIYPVPDSVISFTAAAYKLNPAEYESSDLLIATNLYGVTVADGPVNLTFEHAMAKLNVNLKFRSEFSANTIVSSVTAIAYDSATVNYLTKNMTVAGSAREVLIPQVATPATGYNVSFSGLQVPQEGVKKIAVTIDGRTFVYEATQNIPLDAGKYTTIGLIVGQDKIELEGANVSDWTAGDDLSGGVAELVVDPYNGHDYVDLGLPSGLKWATCNVGASKPEEYGDYFAWGDIVPYYEPGHAQDDLKTYGKDDKKKTYGYAWEPYKWCEGSEKTLTKYCNKSNYGSNGFTDTKTTLDLEDDAARYHWGGIWRMPTKADWKELKDKCKWDRIDAGNTEFGGIAGYKVTSQKEGYKDRFIFLPAAGSRYGTGLNYVGSRGYYWSSLLYTDGYYSTCAWLTWFNSSYVNMNFFGRYYGYSVRPVCP
ncbi:MAG: fimbrillin family protein [Bacteroidaceae bacterium]|nr:fimbrillin family protein [Bacteroidaceae bacterium]